MKNILTLIIVYLSCLLVNAQELGNYRINIGQFDKVKVYDNVNVIYRCLPDSSGYVQFQGSAEFENAFILNVKNDGTLKIQVEPALAGKPNLPTLHIYSDFLVSVENSSDKNLIVLKPEPCAEFSAVQMGNGEVIIEDIKANKVKAAITTGNGTVNISGSCINAEFRMVGAGLIAADRLQAENVQCRILGTGSIGCWPIETLSVKGIGTTKIYYKGNPEIKKTGGGKLYELPDDSDNESDSVRGELKNLNPSAVDAESSVMPDDNDEGEEDEEDDIYEETVVTIDD